MNANEIVTLKVKLFRLFPSLEALRTPAQAAEKKRLTTVIR